LKNFKDFGLSRTSTTRSEKTGSSGTPPLFTLPKEENCYSSGKEESGTKEEGKSKTSKAKSDLRGTDIKIRSYSMARFETKCTTKERRV
jgi:hypothetical protein